MPNNKQQKKKKYNWLGIKYTIAGTFGVILISFIFVFTYNSFAQTYFFNVKNIVVNGLNHLHSQEVITQAQIDEDINILEINLFLVRKRLCSHDWILDAKVARKLPNTIVINLEEQKPLAIISLNKIKYLMNIKGVIFKKWAMSDPVDLPVVEGLNLLDISYKKRKFSKSLSAVMSILKMSGKPDSVIPFNTLMGINIDSEIGLTLYTKGSVGEIKLGNDDYAGKYHCLRRLIPQLRKNNLYDKMKWIDLTDMDRIVVNVPS